MPRRRANATLGALGVLLSGGAAIDHPAGAEPLPSLHQLGDIKPSDWAYQALTGLIERYGCVAGATSSSAQGNRSITRFEAAALLNACLARVTTVSDEVRALVSDFDNELAVLKGRVDGLEDTIGSLEAQAFSTTTKLSGLATLVVGGNSFGGSAINSAANAVNTANQGPLALTNALTFNYDLKLTLDTSFNGSDLLRTELRAGNFDTTSNSFGGGGPTTLSTLETAYQEPAGAHVVGIYKLFYQIPLGGGFTATAGPRVAMEDMVAFWPSVYPDDTVLDVMTMAGAPVAYNYNRGAGVGLWWQRNGWSLSGNYVAYGGGDGNPGTGGIGTANAASSGTLQLGFHDERWGLALTYSGVQNGVVPYATLSLLNGLNGSTSFTNAYALSGYWQPAGAGWLPSISAGWGINTTSSSAPAPAPLTSQSWSVGLQWQDVLVEANAFGLAFGQAPFVTSQSGSATPTDGNWMWEGWYKIQISDNISLTPAIFFLSRPLGQETPAGQSFNQLGALIKTQFRF